MSQTNPIFTDEKNNPHASAAGGAAGQSDLASLALEQTQRTVAESGSAEPKRGRGQRGPDKAPRARPGLRVVDLGKAPGASPLAENASMRPEDFLPSVQPSFDPAAAQEIVQGVIGMLNDGAAAWIETVTLKDGVIHPDRIRERIRAEGPTAPRFERQHLDEDGHVSI